MAVRRVGVEEVLGQQADVLATVAQRRQVHGDGVDAIEEVLAELAALHGRREVAIGGGHQPDVHPARAGAAHAEERAGLQHAQQLHLAVGLHVADLVEQQRAAVRELDEAGLGVDGAGEGALLVAEQLGLQHLAGQRAAVDRHERPLGPRRALVDGAGHQLLAGAALAEHQHRGLRRRHPLDHPHHLVHLGAAGDEAAEGPGPGRVGPERDVVAQELALLGRLADQHLQLLDLGGLGQVVVGSELHRLDGRGHFLEARHDDHLGMLGDLLQLAQDLDAFLLRHLHVQDHHVVGILAHAPQRGLAVADALGLQAPPAQLAHDEITQVVLVVGHQHADLLHAGSTTRKMLPLPRCVCISMRPP